MNTIIRPGCGCRVECLGPDSAIWSSPPCPYTSPFTVGSLRGRQSDAQAAQKADSDAYFANLLERSAAAKVEPTTAKQIKYLEALTVKTDPERFDTEFAKSVKGTPTASKPVGAWEDSCDDESWGGNLVATHCYTSRH